MSYKNKLKLIFTILSFINLTGCGGAKIYSSHQSKPDNGGSSGDDTATPTFAQAIKIIDNLDISFDHINWSTFLNTKFIAVTNDKHLIVSPIKTDSIQFIDKNITQPQNLTAMFPIINSNQSFAIYNQNNSEGLTQSCKYFFDNIIKPYCLNSDNVTYVNFSMANNDIFSADKYGKLYEINLNSDPIQNLNSLTIDTNTIENTLLTTDSMGQYLLALYKTNDSTYDLCATSITKTDIFNRIGCIKNIFPNSIITKQSIFTNGKLVLQFSQQTDNNSHLLSISPYLIDDSTNKLNFISLSTNPITYPNDIPSYVNNPIIPFKYAFDDNKSSLYFVTTENNSSYLNAFHFSIVRNEINVISKKILLGSEKSYSQPFLTTGNLKNPDKKIIITSSSGILKQFSFSYDETQKDFVLKQNTFDNVGYLDPIYKTITDYKLDISRSMNFYTEMTSIETEKDGLQYLMAFSRDSGITPTNHMYKIDLNW